MGFEERYKRDKKKLLNDVSICKENRELFKKFFEKKEYKLKRINGRPSLDESSYKTLANYIHKLKNVNEWFNNKPWKGLTKKDIKKVYDDLEDGKITKSNGKPYKGKADYYNKIFKSTPFEIAGKTSIAKEVMEFYRPKKNNNVRFITLKDFKKLTRAMRTTKQKFLLWLAWDIGENINSLLRLKKSDFVKRTNDSTKEPEYLINLREEILKRTRQPRSEPTNFQETVELADIILKDKEDDDPVFNFQYRQALKFFKRAVKETEIKCKPKGQEPSWKDLRSGMACYLLKNEWSSDEVNARLGHKPSSRVIDKYVSYLALDKQKPKKKLYYNNLNKVREQLQDIKQDNKLKVRRIEKQQGEIEKLKEGMGWMNKFAFLLVKDRQQGLTGREVKELKELANKTKEVI